MPHASTKSDAGKAGPLPPTTTPTQRMDLLRAFLSQQPRSAVLRHALGFDDMPGLSAATGALLEHAVVIGVDTEAWSRNTNLMTEIGLVVFQRRDMVKVFAQQKGKGRKNVGDRDGQSQSHELLGNFGIELLKKIDFYHFRIVEHAHLHTRDEDSKSAPRNRFGHSRFVTFAEARNVLDRLLNQAVVITNPGSTISPTLTAQDHIHCKRPIILMGHALSNDSEHFARPGGLQYDLFKHETIVSQIDTQPLAKETHTWQDLRFPHNNVGLAKLAQTLGFEHDDAHTACNDAARAVIAGIQMVLPWECRVEAGTGWGMQSVAWAIEGLSKKTRIPDWGTEMCCTRCGGRDHREAEGPRCEVPVYCGACARFDKNGEEEHYKTHVEAYCVHVAEYNGWIRRRDHAIRKSKRVPSGPPEGSHPASTPEESTDRWKTAADSDTVASERGLVGSLSNGSPSTFSETSVHALSLTMVSSNRANTMSSRLTENSIENAAIVPIAAATRITTFQSASRERDIRSMGRYSC